MKNVIAILFVLIAAVAVADPVTNDDCSNAAFLIDQGFTFFDVNLCDYENDYDGCGDIAAPGPDGVWRALVRAGDDIRLYATTDGTADFEVVMYLVTDCDEDTQTCVLSSNGDQQMQTIDFHVDTTDLYFLVLDSVSGCGNVHVEMGGVLATHSASWSEVKALY